VRQLEVMQNGDDAADVHRAPRHGAGITIVIETPGASAKVLPPVIEHEPAGVHAWPSVD
jgi:hypothetical protein